MKQQQLLQALDEIAQPLLQSQPLWSRDEVIAMQVQTFRQYRLVAQKHGIHETTVKRMCERVVNSFQTKGMLRAFKKFGWDGRGTSLDPSINNLKQAK